MIKYIVQLYAVLFMGRSTFHLNCILAAHMISELFPIQKLALLGLLSAYTTIHYPKYWYICVALDVVAMMGYSTEAIFVNYMLSGFIPCFINLLF